VISLQSSYNAINEISFCGFLMGGSMSEKPTCVSNATLATSCAKNGCSRKSSSASPAASSASTASCADNNLPSYGAGPRPVPIWPSHGRARVNLVRSSLEEAVIGCKIDSRTQPFHWALRNASTKSIRFSYPLPFGGTADQTITDDLILENE